MKKKSQMERALTEAETSLIVNCLSLGARKNFDDSDMCDKQSRKAVTPADFKALSSTLREQGDACFDLAERLYLRTLHMEKRT